MTSTQPETGPDISFDGDEMDWDDWLKDDFDSPDQEGLRSPVAATGAILKQARRQIGPKGISQEEMARRLGIPKRSYIAYETQDVPKVPVEVLRRLAATTDIDAEFILTGRSRYLDYGPILEEVFELQRYIVKHFHDGDDRVSYDDLQRVIYEVLSGREAERWQSGDPTKQYSRADVAQAVHEYTGYGRRLLDDLSNGSEAD